MTMTGILMGVVVASGLGAVQPGELLVYRGQLAPQENRTAEALPGGTKSVEVTFLVTRADADGFEVRWLVEERGEGGFSWIDRQGSATLDPAGQGTGGRAPALLYVRDDGEAVVSVPAPLLTAGAELVPGNQWEVADRQYEVEDVTKHGGRDVARVRIHNNSGRQGELLLAVNEPLAIELSQRIFMGRGDAYQLRLKLTQRERLDSDAVTRLTQQFDLFEDLKNKLRHGEPRGAVRWNAAQRELLAETLPRMDEQIADGPLVALLHQAARDEQLQTRRDADVQQLRERMLGQSLPEFTLHTLGGETLSAADLTGEVTVLHFWGYRDEPLEPPYGQVGYLDFLYGQRKSQQLRVYGVAVNSRFADAAQRPAATRSVRKLREFMNLDYPILLDDGQLLAALGDPRRLGEALPLFVVIDRQGRIAHYQVGLYDVDASRGLTELDAALAPLLENAQPNTP